MDLNKIKSSLDSISDELYHGGNDWTVKKKLAQLIDEVNAAVKAEAKAASYPEWREAMGVLDPGKVHDALEEAEGTITIKIVRDHLYRINGVSFDFVAGDEADIFNDVQYDAFMDFCSTEFSWTNGQHVPDSYFILALLGTNPDPMILHKFLVGDLRIAGMSEETAQEIFNNWIMFSNRTPQIDYGCIDERESSDS